MMIIKIKNSLSFYSIILLFLSGSIFGQDFLTLDDAIDIALNNSPQIKRSVLNLERSKESLNAQNAALKSRFSLQITPFEYSKDRQFNDFFSRWNTNETTRSYGTLSVSQPVIWTDGTISLINRFSWQDSYSEYEDINSRTFSNNLYLSLNQPLFTYNRTRLQLDELELDLENTALAYAIQRLAITRNVSESFYSLYQQRMRVQISEDEYQSQQKNYELTQNKVDAGIISKDELYQAELNMLNSRIDVQNQQVTLQNQMDQFKQFIGIPIEKEIAIVADVSYNPVEVDLKVAVESGIENRMELRQREIDIESSQFNLIRTSATNEFFGNLQLAVGLIGTDEKFTDIYNTPTNNQQVSFSLDIPLFDWGERESRIKAAETTIRSSELSLSDEKINILVSIRSVYRNLENLETQIEISEINERNAQLSYDINLERYSNGDLTSIDLERFQSQLSQAKLSRVTALISYRLELLNLKIQSLYDFELKAPVIPDVKLDFSEN